MNPRKLIPVLGAALATIGCWLPWLSLDGETLNGFLKQDDAAYGNNLVDFAGFIVIALSALSIIFSFMKKKIFAVLNIVFALMIPVVAFSKFSAEKKLLGDDGSSGLALGNGFFLITGGALLILSISVFSLMKKK